MRGFSTGLAAALPPSIAGEREDPRAGRATTSPWRFAWLMGQLVLLLGVFNLYGIEQPAFLVLGGLIVSGFAVHYWLPFAAKEPFWLALSIAGGFVLLDPRSAVLLLALGGVFYAILAAPASFRVRALVLVALGVALTLARTWPGLGLPDQFWPVAGAVFMFRLMVYAYDVRHATSRPSLRDFVSYFFILPNYYFLLFPVIDFQTLRRTYYQRDIHEVAQQGIGWMVRGTIQLLLYRVIVAWKGPAYAPDAITSAGTLVSSMVLTYLLYLRVSGQFHIIIGMLHLFGYDLPETHRKYLLASSLTDFWRRINIYWKDFMVKLVYFPVYFQLRRRHEVGAQVVATVMVFVVTWFLHSYQWFWLRGEWLFTWPDTLFWAILGALVTVNLLLERRRKPVRGQPGTGSLGNGFKTVATFGLITFLWSMWHAPSMGEWFDVLTWWKVG